MATLQDVRAMDPPKGSKWYWSEISKKAVLLDHEADEVRYKLRGPFETKDEAELAEQP